MAGFESASPDLKPLLGERISRLGLKLEGSPMEDTVYLIEVNPNPYLHSGAEFIAAHVPRSSPASGMPHAHAETDQGHRGHRGSALTEGDHHGIHG